MTRKSVCRGIFRLILVMAFLFAFQAGNQYTIAAASSPQLNLEAVYYVAPSGSDQGECGGQGNPCRTIQYAVNKAGSGSTLRVAAGTYTYNSGEDRCDFLVTRAVVCYVDKHLAILGGYTTSDWSTSNPTQNPTIIDGQNSRRGVAVIAYNATASLRMEGFTVQNGLAQGNNTDPNFGVNALGGGIWTQHGSVNLKNVVLKNNRAISGSMAAGGYALGGGLAIDQTSDGTVSLLENVSFIDNQAIGGNGSERGGIAIGGGIFADKSLVTGNNLVFTNNTAQAGSTSGNGRTSNGALADALGGGAGFQWNSNIVLTNVTFTGNKAVGGAAGNSADSKGGAGVGGGIHAEHSALNLTNVLVQGNSAIGGAAATGGEAFGGGLMTDNTPFTMDRVKVIANASRSGGSSTSNAVGAPGGGGAYVVSFSGAAIQGTITNSIFANNSIGLGSPGANKSGGGGGGLMVQGMTVQIVHSTFAQNAFADNSLVSGQAITVMGQNGNSGVPGVANIQYSIISDHTHTNANASAVTVHPGSRADLNRVLMVNNTNHTNQENKPFPPGTINLSNVTTSNTPVGYVSAGSPNYNYHLAAGSAAIDAGAGSTTTVDIDGEARPIGSAPDLGADELMRPTLQTAKSMMLMVDGQSSSTFRQRIMLYPDSGGAATWTATTNASWLYLGESGTNRTMSGKTGEDLVVRVATKGLENKTYDGTIVLTSPSADGITITIQVIKVGTLYKLHLPTLSKR